MGNIVLKAAAVFSDNMVLQHGKPVPLWGSGTDGRTVCVSFHANADSKNSLKAQAQETKVRGGKWNLTLAPVAAGISGELIINDGTDELRFKNVITGDVWFAGGQSNMEMGLVNCKNGVQELAACANPNIRFYHVTRRAVVDDDYLREEAESCWKACAPETAATLSGAAFFFARKINADMNIPVGIINCSWGGTSISAWMSREQMEKTCAGKKYVDDYDKIIAGKTDEQYNAEMKEYDEQLRQWEARVRERKEKEPGVTQEVLDKECGQAPWYPPDGKASPFCPANLHASRILRTAPFALKGFLYYQGESDDQRAADYRQMMFCLVQQWRDDWKDNTLPFLFVQLPVWATSDKTDAGNLQHNWCLIRENQYLASLDIANSAIAVIIDCGEFDNAHPFDKQTVGYRLALHALKKVYCRNIEADAPVFSWYEVKDGKLYVHFDYAECGLEFHGSTDDKFASFEIAGAEGSYFPAQAEIQGNTVAVYSEKVTDPHRARYVWKKFCPTPLYAKNGLPVMPFRTNRDEPADA
jgi:sialate O-acetylesterase